MMLLCRLPTGSMSMSMPSMSFPSLPAVPTSLPSNSSILLSMLASLIFVLFIRASFLCLRSKFESKEHQQPREKTTEKPQDLRQQRSSWTQGLVSWGSLPNISLPVSLTMMESGSNGRGVGLQEKRRETPAQSWRPAPGRRGGPAFETPLPGLYQSEPASMAKMIMSRHTYRKPTSRPPARTVPPPTRIQILPALSPSHPPSMV